MVNNEQPFNRWETACVEIEIQSETSSTVLDLEVKNRARNLQCSVYCAVFNITLFPVQFGSISDDFELFLLCLIGKWAAVVWDSSPCEWRRIVFVDSGPLHTQDWRPMTIAILELPLVERAETVQVHFTCEGEGVEAQRRLHGWKVYVESYINKVSWSPGIFVKPSSTRWAYRKFRETLIFFNIFSTWRIPR